MVQIPSKTNRIWEKIQEWLFQQRFQDWIKWVVVGICLLIVYIQVQKNIFHEKFFENFFAIC